MGTQPVEEEIPLDLQDFPYIIEQSFNIYFRLSNKFDSVNGHYLGKDFSNVDFYLNIFNVEDRQSALDFITIIDSISQDIRKRNVDGRQNTKL